MRRPHNSVFLGCFLALLTVAGSAAQRPAAPAAATDDQLYAEAAALTQRGDFKGAIQKLEPQRKLPSAPPRLLALLGTLYVQANRPGDALAVLKPLAAPDDAEPAVLYNAGRAALALQQPREAQAYFTRSLARDPATPAARELGLMMAHQGRVVEGYSMLRPWVIHNPNDGEARLVAASLALQLERPAEAQQLISGMAPNDPAIRLLHGEILVQQGDGKGAVALLAPLLPESQHPKGMEPEVRRSLAEAYLLAGQPAPAVELLRGRVAGHPSIALVLAKAQHKSGDILGAMATLRPFVDQLPNDARGAADPRAAGRVAVEYGRLLIDAGRVPEAVQVLDRATHILPESAESWQALSEAQGAAGKRPEAQAAKAKAEELTRAGAAARAAAAQAAAAAAQAAAVAPTTSAASAPAGPEQAAPAGADGRAAGEALSADLNAALTALAENKPEEALAAARREIAAQPRDQRARALEVRSLLLLKRDAEALSAADAALKLEPDNPYLVAQRGAVELSLHQLAAAERDLRRALEIAPRQTGAMNDLAVLLMDQGKNAEAKALLERALAINPEDPAAAANLRRLKGGSGGP
ncbi:MAG TPA: tetratricopeptide repeat protein [Thermoanaerobaculia bacterium]|nr:tetratricopeptide repeat protein [Thermoanaerobaculia bacterium]